MYGIVEVIMDKNKLRVRPVGKRKGFVRFPKDLRLKEGSLFEVTDLRSSKGTDGGKFWIACGDIRQLKRGRRLKYRVKGSRNV